MVSEKHGKRYTSRFKFQVVLEVLRGTKNNYVTKIFFCFFCQLLLFSCGGGDSKNISSPAADIERPIVTAFSLPADSSTLLVSITSFTATDNIGVTGYMVTASATMPSADSGNWTAIPPTSYAFTSTGLQTLYAWAKDAAGNVSLSKSASVNITEVDYRAQALPTKFVGVVAMLSSSFLSKSQQLIRINSVAEKTKDLGLQVVNITLDWRDLHPDQGTFDFSTLDELITAIKSRGLNCVLRIYVNTADNWQAWPAWLTGIQTYNSKFNPAKKNILPWDTTYQGAFEHFMAALSTHAIQKKIEPDAIQITLGGNFGEQVLADYDSAAWNWLVYLNALFAAEKKHIDMYVKTMRNCAADHIVMINSLYPLDSNYEDSVGLYAQRQGVGWIQSNAGACFLIAQSYGPDNARMLARFQLRGARLILEDESGWWSCPAVGHAATLTHRIALMQYLQNTYGLTFSGVTISSDHDLNDVNGIYKLKAFLGL